MSIFLGVLAGTMITSAVGTATIIASAVGSIIGKIVDLCMLIGAVNLAAILFL